MNADLTRLRDWTPVRTLLEPEREAVLWTRFGEREFDLPFFQQTIAARFEAEPGAQVLATPLNVLDGLEGQLPHVTPTGFIFHTSRCGSTLLANALRALEDTLIISEPPPLNELLFLPFRTLREPEDRVRWVRGMIAALCQPRGRGHRRAFIKLTSTNLRCHDIIRAAFPDVPCLFLYRHPVEVLVSFLKDPPGWMGIKAEPGIAEAMLRMPGAELDGASNEEFAARVLGAFYESGLAIAERGTVLDYEQLRPEAMGAIARVFGVEASAGEIRRMGEVFRYHSKNARVNRQFESDTEAKRAVAGEIIEQLANRFAMEPFERLKLMRIPSGGN